MIISLYPPSIKVYFLSSRPVPLSDSLLVLGLLPVPPAVDLAQWRLVDVQRVAVPELRPGSESKHPDIVRLFGTQLRFPKKSLKDQQTPHEGDQDFCLGE